MEIKVNKILNANGEEDRSERPVMAVMETVTDVASDKDMMPATEKTFELTLDARFPDLVISMAEHGCQECCAVADIAEPDGIRRFVSELRTWCDNAEKVLGNVD